MRRFKGQTGMSLVEATIILLVLMLLTAVLAPSIWDYFKDAQSVKVKEDCEAIGGAVARLVRDVGSCLKISGSAGCTLSNRADVLVSDGPTAFSHTTTSYTPITSTMLTGDWCTAIQAGGQQNVAACRMSPMTYQFTTNNSGNATAIYTDIAGSNPPGWSWSSGPTFGLGWRGAYLPSPIGPDPWGNVYFVNSGFLATASDAAGTTGIGEKAGGWPFDVFCLSAGFNGIFETPFNGTGRTTAPYGTERGGDDFIYVVAGASR